jgi:hypothetical protein
MHEFESVVEKFLNRKKEKEHKGSHRQHHTLSYLMPRVVAILKKSHPNVKIMIEILFA